MCWNSLCYFQHPVWWQEILKKFMKLFIWYRSPSKLMSQALARPYICPGCPSARSTCLVSLLGSKKNFNSKFDPNWKLTFLIIFIKLIIIGGLADELWIVPLEYFSCRVLATIGVIEVYAGDPKTNPIMLTPVRSADAGGFAVFKVCGLVYKQGASLAVGGLNDFSADVPAKILFYTHDTKVPNLLSIKNCVQLYTFLKSLMWRLLVEFPINDGVAWEKVGHAAAFNFLAWNLEIKMNVLFSGDDFIVTRIFIHILARYIYEIFFPPVVLIISIFL